jgi:hypothetical protein
MLVAPIWILIDLITKSNSMLRMYHKMEARTIKYAVPLILLVIINWIWNITKEL